MHTYTLCHCAERTESLIECNKRNNIAISSLISSRKGLSVLRKYLSTYEYLQKEMIGLQKRFLCSIG